MIMQNELIDLSKLEGKSILIEIIKGDESEVATGIVRRFGTESFGVVCGSETIHQERIISILQVK